LSTIGKDCAPAEENFNGGHFKKKIQNKNLRVLFARDQSSVYEAVMVGFCVGEKSPT
jgi:hypothetical protein